MIDEADLSDTHTFESCDAERIEIIPLILTRIQIHHIDDTIIQ